MGKGYACELCRSKCQRFGNKWMEKDNQFGDWTMLPLRWQIWSWSIDGYSHNNAMLIRPLNNAKF